MPPADAHTTTTFKEIPEIPTKSDIDTTYDTSSIHTIFTTNSNIVPRIVKAIHEAYNG